MPPYMRDGWRNHNNNTVICQYRIITEDTVRIS